MGELFSSTCNIFCLRSLDLKFSFTAQSSAKPFGERQWSPILNFGKPKCSSWNICREKLQIKNTMVCTHHNTAAWLRRLLQLMVDCS